MSIWSLQDLRECRHTEVPWYFSQLPNTKYLFPLRWEEVLLIAIC